MLGSGYEIVDSIPPDQRSQGRKHYELWDRMADDIRSGLIVKMPANRSYTIIRAMAVRGLDVVVIQRQDFQYVKLKDNT